MSETRVESTSFSVTESLAPVPAGASRSELIDQAAAFEESLRAKGALDWPANFKQSRIATILRLLNATLLPDQTRSLSRTGGQRVMVDVPEKVGRFERGPQVGQGGFGVVYRSYDTLLHREVALKAIPRRGGFGAADENERWREARAAARLNHPALVPLYEVLDDAHHLYLISEYCAGPTLAKYLQAEENGGKLLPDWAAEITLKLAQAVAHAHGRGLVHRDIKPSNVLLSPERADGDLLPFTPRLTDFGLVIDSNSEASHANPDRIVGTILYMAPEQVVGNPESDARRWDVYALGLLLYQMLSGRLPYQEKTPLSLLEEICTSPIPEIRDSLRPISRDLRAIYFKALAKQPEQRYASAQSLVDDLLRLKEGREVAARPRSGLERASIVVAQAPLLFTLLVALVALAIASGAMLAWNNRRLSEQSEVLNEALSAASVSRREVVEIAFRSDLYQAFLSLAKGDPASAMATLDDLRGYANPEDLDRFDARLLTSLTHDGWTAMPRMDGKVEEMVPFADNRRFAVAGGNQLRIYGAGQNEPSRMITFGDGELIHGLAIAPDDDLIAVGLSAAANMWTWVGFSSDQVRFVSLSGNEVPSTIQSFYATIDSLAFSQDGQRLAVGTRYEPIQIHELSGRVPPTLIPSTRRNEDVCLGPNHRLTWLKTRSELLVRSDADDSSTVEIRSPQATSFRRFHSSADGRWIAATLHNVNDVFLYEVDKGIARATVLRNDRGELRSIRLSPSGDYLAGGTIGGGVAVWKNPGSSDDDEQTLIEPIKYHSVHGGEVWAIAINDAGTVFSGGIDGSLARFDLNTLEPTPQRLVRDDLSMTAEVTSDGQTLLIGRKDGSVWSLDLATRDRQRLHPPGDRQVHELKLSPDGRWMIAGWQDGRVAAATLRQPTKWRTLIGKLENEDYTPVANIIFERVGNRVLFCRGPCHLHCFEVHATPSLPDEMVVSEIASFHAPTSIEAVAFLPDRRVIAIGDTIRIWDGNPGSLPQSRPGVPELECHITDDDRQLIYLGCEDGRIRAIDFEGQAVATSLRWSPTVTAPQVTRRIMAITLTPDRVNLLTGSDCGDLGIWDAETLKYLGEVWQADFEGEIEQISIIPRELRTGREVLFAHQRDLYGEDLPNGKVRFIPLETP